LIPTGANVSAREIPGGGLSVKVTDYHPPRGILGARPYPDRSTLPLVRGAVLPYPVWAMDDTQVDTENTGTQAVGSYATIRIDCGSR